MATPTDPTFGSDFDADAFRSAITSTMEMGMASGSDEATFYWKATHTYDYQSGDRTPYDLSATPAASVAYRELVLPVAQEFVSRSTGDRGTPFGEIQEPRMILTMLDIHYDQITGADGVIFSGADYSIDYTAPAIGLFGVNVYELHLSAMDES